MSKRETIMAALLTALQSIDDDGDEELAVIDRNGATELAEGDRPAVRMWDGDEVATTIEARPLSRKAPVFVTAEPAIFGYVRSTAAGTDTNALLARVRKAIYTNAALAAAIGTDGSISQSSLVTDLQPGKKTEGMFGLHLSLTYSFDPTNP